MDLVREVLGDYPVTSVRPLGTGGDNVAYEVNGDLVVRFRRRDGEGVAGSVAGSAADLVEGSVGHLIAGSVVREAAVLRLVAGVSPLAVPVPLVVDAERGCLVYRRLPGVPLLGLRWAAGRPQPELDQAGAEAVGATLGAFLAALHSVPVSAVANLVETDETPPQEWLDEAAAAWPRVRGDLPAAGVEAFLGRPAPPPGTEFVFSHQDLGIEHVLVDPASGAVTGVIDWTDAAVGDPAYDLGLILRDLGPGALDAALRVCGPGDAAVRERAVFYARCGLIEDLAYGQETDRPEYVRKGVAAIEWLFN
jgi:aminoglycoside phosphotransferase (APT) family kinase protein